MIWTPLSKTMPRSGQVVLTAHEDDLYPVPAFWVQGTEEEGILWMRELEGPEDGDHQTYESLYRPPTHWTEVRMPRNGR